MKKIAICVVFVIWVMMCFGARLVGLEKSPISINFDEAGLGYNAYSLLLTGKDEYGISWPISLRSFNDYKPALYSYLSIPFVKWWGLNQTSTRAVSAVFGTISLVFLFFILRKITKQNGWIILGVMVFISFLPWRLHYSRVAFESNLSMAFFTMMVWSLLNFEKRLYKVLIIIFGLLAIYSYHGARLAVPVLLTTYWLDPLVLKKILTNWKKVWPVLVIGVLSVPIVLGSSSNSVLRRFNQTNIFHKYYPFTPTELVSTTSNWWLVGTNPLYYLGGILAGHTLSILSPKNMGLEAYHWVTRSPQTIAGGGMMGWLGALFLIVGMWTGMKRLMKDKNYRLILYWILAGVAPVAVTMEWFHPLRSLNAFPAIEIILGLGIITIGQLIKNKGVVKYLVLVVMLVLMIGTCTYNILNELNYSIWASNGEFQPGGYKEGAILLWSLKDRYKTIYLDSPHAQNYVMFAFYMKYPPEKIQQYAAIRPPMGTEGSLNFNFDNFVLGQKYDWIKFRNYNDFAFWTSSEVKEDEIKAVSGARLYKIYDGLGRWAASVITKE